MTTQTTSKRSFADDFKRETVLLLASSGRPLTLDGRYGGRLTHRSYTTKGDTTGDSYDNALAETINGLYKAKVIWRQRSWSSASAVEMATLRWVNWFNNHRLLGPIGYIPPPRPKKTTMPPSRNLIWPHNSNETDSGKPGTLHGRGAGLICGPDHRRGHPRLAIMAAPMPQT